MRARRLTLAALLACTVSSSAAHAAPGDIEPLAGGHGAGPAREIAFTPRGIAAWNGRLAAVDDAGTVRAIDVATGATTILAGAGFSAMDPTGTIKPGATLSSTHAVAAAPDGGLLVTDQCGVLRFDPLTLAGTRIAGDCAADSEVEDGSPARSGLLTLPQAIAVQQDGTILFVDHVQRLRRIDATTGTVSTLGAPSPDPNTGVANGVALRDAYFNGISGVSLDRLTGDLVIAEDQGHRVRRVVAGVDRRIDAGDPVTVVAGTGAEGDSGDGGPATAAQLNRPGGVAVLADGRIVVSDRLNRRVRMITRDGAISTIATGVQAAAAAGRPTFESHLVRFTAAAEIGEHVYIADGYASGIANGSLHQVLQVDLATTPPSVTRVAGNGTPSFSGEGVSATDAQLGRPTDVATLPDGSLVVADSGSRRVRRIDRQGQITTLAGTGSSCGVPGECGEGGPARTARLDGPAAVATAADGSVFIADTSSEQWIARIVKIDAEGRLQIVTGPADDFVEPGLADGSLADARFSENIDALTLSADGRRLYVADSGNSRVRLVDLQAGTVSTVAGNGFPDRAPDDEGGPALDAQIGPGGLALLADGDLLVSDTPNHRVRRIDAETQRITTVIGNGRDPDALEDPTTFDYEEDGEVLEPLAAPVLTPRGLAVRADGAIAIAAGSKVWLQEPGGPGIRRVIGAQTRMGFTGDRGPGLQRLMSHTRAVAFTRDGSMVTADAALGRLFRLTPPAPLVRLTAVAPSRLVAGGEPVRVELRTGEALVAAGLDAGPGVSVTELARDGSDPTRWTAVLRASTDTATGPRNVTLITRDAAHATCASCLTIDAAPVPVPDPPETAPITRPAPPVPIPTPAAPVRSTTSVRVPATARRATLRRGLPVTVTASAGGRVTVELRIDRAKARRLQLSSGRLARVSRSATAGRALTVRLKPSARTQRALQRSRAGLRATVTITIVGTDGTRAKTEKKLWLR
ncbi:hypothetical protein DVA67_007230 [Solirubrobacter sp. CPCC 204708]|uniref:Teneurin NHL domain-containing protein n=1 Tax=Solirubrobacter deserti TaxID=2282478 RepID=A0ABT4RP54_9ACTN|nr:hypothetical protein [Solirubrobacter deserti]MBE2315762.1 hypothetical protein [Solirubrobacter deserti]MDA0140348.1 hypothetical protein [Solirubrobacter deserti]